MGRNTKLENKFIDMGEIFVDSLGNYPECTGKQLQTLRTPSEESASLDFSCSALLSKKNAMHMEGSIEARGKEKT